MRDLLHASVDLLGMARIARHSLELEVPDDAVPVWANPTEVLQVVVNLAINACDSSKGSSPAKVSVRASPPGTPPPARCPDIGEPLSPDDPVSVFAVTDTGTGISPEVLSRMFQRNFTTKGAAGTGMGLLIVASILQANHASLWVDTSPGQGTTMTVAWPARAAGGEAMPLATRRFVDRDTSSRLDPHLLKGVQALVVDDLPEVSRVLADMLESAGAVAFSETDPAFVKEVLAEAPQDWSVLVTDLHMPGIDGHALARFAMNLSPPVPVVLVTARPDTVSEISLRDFAVVLAKPVSVGELAHAVRSVIDGKGDRST